MRGVKGMHGLIASALALLLMGSCFAPTPVHAAGAAGAPAVRKPAAAAPMPDVMPSFQKFRNGNMTVTTLYDGYVPIMAKNMHGAPPEQIRDLLKAAMLPPAGDALTSVNGFLVELDGSRMLIDTGAGNALGPHTGKLMQSLRASGTEPIMVNHILLTHLHPDHVRGLLLDSGEAAFPRAEVHVSREEANYWLDSVRAEKATGLQKDAHRWATEALAPYIKSGRLRLFSLGQRPLPGIRSVPLDGHTPGHIGYLLGAGKDEILFWGDTVHSHAVQLPLPQVTVEYDADASHAIASRQSILQRAVARKWLVGGAHMPFPGLGHLRKKGDGYAWDPELRQSNGRPPGSQ